MAVQTRSARIKRNVFNRSVTSAHADAWARSKCFADNSNLLAAVIAFNNCCDPVARTPIVSMQLCICPAAGSGRQEHPGDGPSSALCLTLSNSPTGTDSRFDSAFLLKAAALGHLAADEASETSAVAFCQIFKSK